MTYLGNWLKNRRLDIGISQRELGRRIGLTGGQVSKYELGLDTPHLKRITALARVLNTTANEIFQQAQRDFDVSNVHTEPGAVSIMDGQRSGSGERSEGVVQPMRGQAD